MRYSGSLMLTVLLLSGCGDPTLSTTALDTPTPAATDDIGIEYITGQSGPLSDSIELGGGVSFPGSPALVEDNFPMISIAPDYTVTISNIDGVRQSFADSDVVQPLVGDYRSYIKNGGTDALIFNKPFTITDPSTGDFGLDYAAFGVWLLGASEDIAAATGPFDIEEAGGVAGRSLNAGR